MCGLVFVGTLCRAALMSGCQGQRSKDSKRGLGSPGDDSLAPFLLTLPHFKGEGHPKDGEQGPASTGGEEQGAVNSVGDWNFKLD